ncbi:MAG: Gfo/Idh/MocA family oxidoreductase [Proteobacteria bacterium]|nr:Gfo/Idh/MocA family oxidoreductase [Pseudomonadota bacterium]MBI3498139.1 Gfo/Idh/MocA family oxidoreductase [Pseudomonadota bacterium]
MAHGIGFIGLGIMGQRMLASLALNPRVEAVAVWDPNPAACARTKKSHPRLRIARGSSELVADPGVACVYIASPPSTHLTHAATAFDAGKAVLSEKPLGVDTEESDRMVARVEREVHRAAINFPFASSPAALALKDMLAADAVGTPERIEIETVFAEWPRPWQADARWLCLREEGGFVREVVSHFLFLTRRLIGPLAVKASKTSYPDDGRSAETAIAADLTAAGIPVRLTGGVRGMAADSNAWTASGAKGHLRLHDWTNLSREQAGSWSPVDLGPGELRPRSAKAQLDGVADMIEGKPHGLASFRDGLEVQRAVEELLSRTR